MDLPLFGNFHFIDKKKSQIMNITLFLLKKFHTLFFIVYVLEPRSFSHFSFEHFNFARKNCKF